MTLKNKVWDGVRVARAVNGISINGVEYLLDESGDYLEFDNKEDAECFLKDKGLTNEELEAIVYFRPREVTEKIIGKYNDILDEQLNRDFKFNSGDCDPSIAFRMQLMLKEYVEHLVYMNTTWEPI